MQRNRTTVAIVTVALMLPLLSACGGSASADSTSAASDVPAAQSAVDGASSPASAATANPTASLTWPKGTDEFPLNVCASVGKNTIQGGGSTDAWNLQFDANLLEAGDEGTLIVSDKQQGMTVVYDAKITSLTVNPDGSFTGAGQDAGQSPFTITGTCTVSWS